MTTLCRAPANPDPSLATLMPKADPIVLIRLQIETTPEKANQILNDFLGRVQQSARNNPSPLC